MKLPEEISVSVKDVPEVIKQFEIANKEIERLNNKIDKAIEYINKEFVFSDGTLGEADIKLLEILKGEDKE